MEETDLAAQMGNMFVENVAWPPTEGNEDDVRTSIMRWLYHESARLMHHECALMELHNVADEPVPVRQPRKRTWRRRP